VDEDAAEAEIAEIEADAVEVDKEDKTGIAVDKVDKEDKTGIGQITGKEDKRMDSRISQIDRIFPRSCVINALKSFTTDAIVH